MHYPKDSMKRHKIHIISKATTKCYNTDIFKHFIKFLAILKEVFLWQSCIIEAVSYIWSFISHNCLKCK